MPAVRAGHEGWPGLPMQLGRAGGVQEHIRDLAEALMDLVHEVSVISPAGDDKLLPRPRRAGRPGGSRPLQRRGALTSRLPGRSGC